MIERAVRVVADTNVVVRLLVADDRAQLARVLARAEKVGAAGGEIVVPTLVLAESSWVLAAGYKQAKRDVVKAFRALFATRPFVAEEPELVHEALRLAEHGPAEIADYLILAGARRGGALLLSFDAKLGREPDVEKP